MRKITTGIVGGPILGSLVTIDNVLQSQNNNDVTITPNGTGLTVSNADIQIDGNNGLKLSDSGSNFVTLQAPAAASSNYTLTFPADAGTNTYVLTTNGSGTLTWEEVAVQVSDQAADATSYYPTFTTLTSGGLTTISVSSTKLTFQPSTGTLSSTILNCTDITATGDLQAATITETSSITLKENISPVTDAMDKILKLNPVTYTRKTTGAIETGLLAEDVAQIIPELVERDRRGVPERIAYTRITAYLIDVVKTLKSEIDTLKKG
jgi:hypothetical protein